MSSLTVYLVLMLDNIVGVLRVSWVLSGFAVACLTMLKLASDADSGYLRYGKKTLLAGVAAFLLLALAATLVPDTKQMCAIIVLPKIANNEQLQQDCAEFYDLAKKGLRKQLEK